MEAAFDWLRKKGQATIAKRDRATKEGLVSLAVEGTRGVAVEVCFKTSYPSPTLPSSLLPFVLIASFSFNPSLPLPPSLPPFLPPFLPLQVNSETDFVARNADFQAFVAGATKTALSMTAGAAAGVGSMERDALMAVGREGGREGGPCCCNS